MRLINAETLELVELTGGRKPAYYILSHRWQEDEISYKDFKKGRRQDSQGYKKVLNFCKFARGRHDYHRKCLEQSQSWSSLFVHPCFVWIDTCCIDKSSSAELSLSINSMWKWYKDAYECHIYLADVEPNVQGSEFSHQLRNSVWFRRGWTLQELLAPNTDTVRLMLNNVWEIIGTLSSHGYECADGEKPSLLPIVSRITHIHEDYLTGGRKVEEASIACRMSWASGRTTTLVEDEAYCLMGIFNVNMPLLYGEGRKAFRRLQEEIMKTSTDHSIFASVHEVDRHSFKMLSESPGGFRCTWCGDRVIDSFNVKDAEQRLTIRPFEMTNLGIRFRAAIQRGAVAVSSDGPTVGWAFRLNCFDTARPKDGPVPIVIALSEVRQEDESIEQPLVFTKKRVIRGEKELQNYFQSLERPVLKTFYVEV